MIEIFKSFLAIPSGINGIVAGRAAYKATMQLKRDIAIYMKRGVSKVDRVLSSASIIQKNKASQEFKNWSLPKSNPNAIRNFKVHGCPPVHHVQQLFSLRNNIASVLSTPGVFLDPKLRAKLISLDNKLNDYELSYANHGNSRFHYARCYILRSKMNDIKFDTGF